MTSIRTRAGETRPRSSTPLQSLAWLALLGSVSACSAEASSDSTEPATGGQASNGGAVNTGGAGKSGGSGGAGSGQGGAAGGGGSATSGGTSASGGKSATGGAAATGGAMTGGMGGTNAQAALCRLQLSCASEIEDDPKVTCTLQISDGAGAAVFMDQAGVELRGRSSLAYPKKNYGVELRNASGAENPVPMMGMGKESDWIFDGSWVDRSFMRNDLVFGLFRDLGRYAAESRYCTLSLNGENQGIYRLVEKLKRDDDRVAIPLDDGTGKSFVISQDDDGTLNFPVGGATNSGIWQLVYPKQDTATPAQKSAVQAWLDGLRAAMNGADPGNPTTGVFSYLDIGSTVDFILLEEFAKNVDAYNLSLNLYKAPGAPANFIPWDFDLAFGQPTVRNAATPNEAPEGWVQNRTPFITALSKVPGLPARLGPRWRELRAGPFANAGIFAKVDQMQAVLSPAAIAENFMVWPINQVDFTQIYRPYSLYSVSSYSEEVQRLRTWITSRLAWIDAHVDSYPN